MPQYQGGVIPQPIKKPNQNQFLSNSTQAGQPKPPQIGLPPVQPTANGPQLAGALNSMSSNGWGGQTTKGASNDVVGPQLNTMAQTTAGVQGNGMASMFGNSPSTGTMNWNESMGPSYNPSNTSSTDVMAGNYSGPTGPGTPGSYGAGSTMGPSQGVGQTMGPSQNSGAQTTPLNQTPGGQWGNIGSYDYNGDLGTRSTATQSSGGYTPGSPTNAGGGDNRTQWNSNFGPVDTGTDEFRQFGDQMYNHAVNRMTPQLEQRESQVNQSLIDRGLQPGTDAYNAEKMLMAQSRNDMLSATALGAEQLGLQAQNQYFGQQSQNNQFGLAQNQQNYGQEFGYDQLANALQQSQIGASAQRASANASANASMHNANLNNQLGMSQLASNDRQFDVNNIFNTNGQNQNFLLGALGQYGNFMNNNLGQFNAQQAANNNWFNQNGSMMQNAPGVIFNPNQGYTGNQIQGNQNYLGALGQDNQMGASLLGGALGAFSDRRLKTNIEHVDTVDGVNVYEFDYIDKRLGKDRYRGVMAQDVINDYPESVHDFGGYYVVDYSQLPVNMEIVEKVA